MRPASNEEYPHDGRASVARPSNQEKSQPSTGTDAPSATSSSNVGDECIRTVGPAGFSLLASTAPGR